MGDQEAHKRIEVIGSRLKDNAKPMVAHKERVKLLAEASDLLATIPQGSERCQTFESAIISHSNIHAKDKDAKLNAAVCLGEILRIDAPDMPYTDEKTQADLYDCIINALSRLKETTGAARPARTLLKTVAGVKICVPMLDLEESGDRLTKALLRTSLDCVTPHNLSEIGQGIIDTITYVLDEVDSVSMDLFCLVAMRLVSKDSSVSEITARLVNEASMSLAPAAEEFFKAHIRGGKIPKEARAKANAIAMALAVAATESIVAVCSQQLVSEMRTDGAEARSRAVELVGSMINGIAFNKANRKESDDRDDESNANASVRLLLEEHMRRFHDKDAHIRAQMARWAKPMLVEGGNGVPAGLLDGVDGGEQNSNSPGTPGQAPQTKGSRKDAKQQKVERKRSGMNKRLLDSLEERLLDSDERVRAAAVGAVGEIAEEGLQGMPMKMIESAAERMMDRKLPVRKEACTRLAGAHGAYLVRKAKMGPSEEEDEKMGWIPAKILRLVADEQMWPTLDESMFTEWCIPLGKVPNWVTAESWVLTWRHAGDVEKRCLAVMLERRQAFRSAVGKYLDLRQRAKGKTDEQNSSKQNGNEPEESEVGGKQNGEGRGGDAQGGDQKAQGGGEKEKEFGKQGNRFDITSTDLAIACNDISNQFEDMKKTANAFMQLHNNGSASAFRSIRLAFQSNAGTNDLKRNSDEATARARGGKSTPDSKIAGRICRRVGLGPIPPPVVASIAELGLDSAKEEAVNAQDEVSAASFLLRTLSEKMPELFHGATLKALVRLLGEIQPGTARSHVLDSISISSSLLSLSDLDLSSSVSPYSELMASGRGLGGNSSDANGKEAAHEAKSGMRAICAIESDDYTYKFVSETLEPIACGDSNENVSLSQRLASIKALSALPKFKSLSEFTWVAEMFSTLIEMAINGLNGLSEKDNRLEKQANDITLAAVKAVIKLFNAPSQRNDEGAYEHENEGRNATSVQKENINRICDSLNATFATLNGKSGPSEATRVASELAWEAVKLSKGCEAHVHGELFVRASAVIASKSTDLGQRRAGKLRMLLGRGQLAGKWSAALALRSSFDDASLKAFGDYVSLCRQRPSWHSYTNGLEIAEPNNGENRHTDEDSNGITGLPDYSIVFLIFILPCIDSFPSLPQWALDSLRHALETFLKEDGRAPEAATLSAIIKLIRHAKLAESAIADVVESNQMHVSSDIILKIIHDICNERGFDMSLPFSGKAKLPKQMYVHKRGEPISAARRTDRGCLPTGFSLGSQKGKRPRASDAKAGGKAAARKARRQSMQEDDDSDESGDDVDGALVGKEGGNQVGEGNAKTRAGKRAETGNNEQGGPLMMKRNR